MVDLTTLTTPFGLLEPEVQEALRRHGGPYVVFGSGGRWADITSPSWDACIVYRVKVEPIELWVNLYREKGAAYGYAYDTKEKADRYKGENRIRVVRMREVNDA